ncbi:MAG: hypothetical protein QOH01_3101 [Verrucomicrobiota bacterium]|jgi:hypothetical protein
MPKVAFLIPADGSHAFLSQVAAFTTACRNLNWQEWEPEILVCVGGSLDSNVIEFWRRDFPEVTFVLAPRSQSEKTPVFYAQIDGSFRWAPIDADVLVRMDADTLPVGGFEDVLEYVAKINAIAGVMAHLPFPVPPGMTALQGWLSVADGLVTRPLDFRQSYSLVESTAMKENTIAPFYVNDGAVFIPRPIFHEFANAYLDLRPKVIERLFEPYYAGQVALALAVTRIGARSCALPMRYNFPNDERAIIRFPEELDNVKIFHYLRTHEFERKTIFSHEDRYQEFLHSTVSGVNKIFQEHVRRVIGPTLPFGQDCLGGPP